MELQSIDHMGSSRSNPLSFFGGATAPLRLLRKTPDYEQMNGLRAGVARPCILIELVQRRKTLWFALSGMQGPSPTGAESGAVFRKNFWSGR